MGDEGNQWFQDAEETIVDMCEDYNEVDRTQLPPARYASLEFDRLWPEVLFNPSNTGAFERASMSYQHSYLGKKFKFDSDMLGPGGLPRPAI